MGVYMGVYINIFTCQLHT